LRGFPPDIRLDRAILFGSRARGEHRPDSDADVALNLHERGDDGLTLMMLAELAYYAYLDTGIMVQPVPIAIEDWLNPAAFPRPGFLRNIASDSAVSRSHHAMFDIARIALLRAGVTEDMLPRTHTGVIEAFRNHAVLSGKIVRQLATQLSHASRPRWRLKLLGRITARWVKASSSTDTGIVRT